MSLLIALVTAILAVTSQTIPPPADFNEVVLRCDRAVIEAHFVGCESIADDGETYYAGLSSDAGLVTGP